MKIIMKILTRLAVGFYSVLFAGTVFAHHSYAPYDIRNAVDLAGEVKSFRFVAPHPRLVLIDADGNEWNIEVPIMFWRNAEYPEDAIKDGDQIVVKGFTARNGSKKMAMAGFEVHGTYYPVHENIRQRTAVEAADRIEAGEDLETVLADYPEPEEGAPRQPRSGGMGMGMGMGGMGTDAQE